MKELKLKVRGKSHYSSWALILQSEMTPRLGIGVKQENATGDSSMFAWMTRDQIISIRKTMNAFLRRTRK